jgi:hypothetical protein
MIANRALAQSSPQRVSRIFFNVQPVGYGKEKEKEKRGTHAT